MTIAQVVPKKVPTTFLHHPKKVPTTFGAEPTALNPTLRVYSRRTIESHVPPMASRVMIIDDTQTPRRSV
jgi:hypothetical protein